MGTLQDGGVEVGSADSRLQVRPRCRSSACTWRWRRRYVRDDMNASWMNGHGEHRAAGSAVVGIDTGPTPDETIFDDEATIAGPARRDDADVTNTQR
jgi:hypothetical protein